MKLRCEFLSRAGLPWPVRIGGFPLFCNQCGGKIADGSVFCNLCGAKQGVVVPAQGPQPGLPQAPGLPGGAGGQPYNPAAPVQAVAPPPLPQSFKCSSCGGPMNPSSGLALVVCEYCGAVTTMGAGGAAQVIQKHFMLNNRLNNESAMEADGKWLNKGIFRRKVAERSELGAVTLKYVPYWVVPVRDRIQLQRNIPVVAVRGYAQYQPEDGFTFELANKMNFDKRKTGGVDVQSGDISESEAKAQAAALAHKFAEREAKKRVDNLESIQVYPTTYDGELLHAPVWFMEYQHKGKQMFILIDGGSGTVMNGERPAFALW